MTINFLSQEPACPAEKLLRILSGKWKPEIFRLASNGPLRFNNLLRQLPGANKQSLSTALREMENNGILARKVVREKPLHVEYTLTPWGSSLIPLFRQIEKLLPE